MLPTPNTYHRRLSRSLQGRVDPGAIRAQQGAAKAAAVVTAAAAGSLVGLYLKDAVMGAGGGEYNEDY